MTAVVGTAAMLLLGLLLAFCLGSCGRRFLGFSGLLGLFGFLGFFLRFFLLLRCFCRLLGAFLAAISAAAGTGSLLLGSLCRCFLAEFVFALK